MTLSPFVRRLVGIIGLAVLLASAATAADMRPFTHDQGTTEIPVAPQRIVALQDISVTIPLVEVGVMPVGSAGRVEPTDGTIYIRSGMSLVKTDFTNSDITYVGSMSEPDLEAIAALNPDLIITGRDTAYDQLSLIAPTVVLDFNQHPGLEQLRLVADAAGVLPRYEALAERYAGQIARLRAMIPNAQNIRVSLMQASGGTVTVYYYPERGALGFILTELGFQMPSVAAEAHARVQLSAEQLQEIDGDFMIDTFRLDFGQTPATARAAMDEVLPDWCAFLHACRHNQYFAVPRDEALAISFSALDLMMMAVMTNIAGRDFVPFEG